MRSAPGAAQEDRPAQLGPGRRARAYHSPRRREGARRTRARIVAAATAEFTASGYAATTMRAIATAAGVSVPTVELAFGTKAQVLKVAIDVAIAGDDEPVPVLERDWAADARAAGPVGDFLAIVERVLVEAARRSAGLVVAAFEAAAADPALRPLARQLRAQRAATAGWIADGVIARSALRPEINRAHAVDVVWLLMDPVVFGRLTDDRGWSPERYGRWFTDSLQRLLLADPS